jgi:phosphoribosylanthranilate isomerase
MLKVCGARTRDDIELLAAAGADFVGLWHGVPGGHADLSVAEATELADAARDTRRLRPVLVTFSGDVDLLAGALERTGIRWLQLHAYQSPAVVRGLRARFPHDLTIVKVVHLADGHCVERPLIRAYERAGTDIFLLDRVTADGRIGSTGQQLREAEIAELVPLFTRPFVLAGGISADNRADYDGVVDHPRFYGIDVDSAARDEGGRFRPAFVAQLRQGWRTA